MTAATPQYITGQAFDGSDRSYEDFEYDLVNTMNYNSMAARRSRETAPSSC